MASKKRKRLLFAKRKNGVKIFVLPFGTIFTCFVGLFFNFYSIFLTISSKNRLSLSNKGAIFALRAEGYSLCQIRCEFDIKRGAEKNCVEELDEHHSGVPQLALQIHARPNAGHGGCPRKPH